MKTSAMDEEEEEEEEEEEGLWRRRTVSATALHWCKSRSRGRPVLRFNEIQFSPYPAMLL